ncbi:flagellar hook protein FlgE [Pseudomonadota bacterium]
MPFRIALSGLNSASADLKATGNNIANASTTGFKSSRTEFADVFAVGFGGISSTAIGGGVRLAAVTQQFSQGNVDFTDNALDLAVNGQGFFVLSDSGSRVLGRAGAFSADREGFVVNSRSQRLQVFPAITSASGTTFDTGRLSDLQLSTAEGAPRATDEIASTLNLSASESVPSLAFLATNPDSYNSSTSLTVYDSLGAQHTATQYFRKSAPNQWEAYLEVDGNLLNQIDPNTGDPQPLVLNFGTDGALNLATTDAANDGVAATNNDFSGIPPQAGIYHVGDTTTITAQTGGAELQVNLDLRNITQYGSAFGVNALTQSGFATGRLSGVDIDAEGVISARFTNGQSQILGKVALANVPNPQGLTPQGDTTWGESFGGGDLVLGEAGSSSFGLIQSGALESSNVDVASELVNLITAQRNFQANAQVISTADTVTQTIINIR